MPLQRPISGKARMDCVASSANLVAGRIASRKSVNRQVRVCIIIIIISHTLMAKANQGGGEGDYSQPWQKKEERKRSANQNNNNKRRLGCKSSCIIRFKRLRETVREITNKGRNVFT